MTGAWQRSFSPILHLSVADAVAAAAAGVAVGDQVECDGADSVAGTFAKGRNNRRSQREEATAYTGHADGWSDGRLALGSACNED